LRIYKANEVDKERFYQVPKSLFKNKLYTKLSLDAKMVYALLRDRMELSQKNGWINSNGEIYLLFTRENLANILECSEPTARKAMKQLIEHKLIIEKRQGQGKPNIIYVCHTEKTLDIAQTEKFFRSGTENVYPLNPKNISPNDTESNDTDLNDTDNNHNGAISGEDRTAYYSKQPMDIETVEAISTFMNDYYKQKKTSLILD
jgi:hypothetical protein